MTDDLRFSPEELWKKALTDLSGQMTRATFETWFVGSRGIEYDTDGALVVNVPSAYAIDYLVNRENRRIIPILERHGHTAKIRYFAGTRLLPTPSNAPPDGTAALLDVAREEALKRPPTPLSDGAIQLVNFDPATKGFVMTSAYAFQFWQPYLGLGPFITWQTLRSFGLSGAQWPKLQTLADICCNGNKQTLTGRAYRGKYVKGWLEVLEEENLLWYQRKGSNYSFRVVDILPVLVPGQVSKLPKLRQQAHADFIDNVKLDRQEWEQLTLASLSQGPEGGSAALPQEKRRRKKA